ncbi:MAG: hypothetical protein H8D37_03075 [Chloroflexi bacterium]|nr:hypothetical protein [Chloroflexota bacterium]
MTITTYEGIVKKGTIRFETPVHLPDNTKVFVIVPEMQIKPTARIMSPRLVHREQVADFHLEVSEDNPNASIQR